jgi:hypothetical protein
MALTLTEKFRGAVGGKALRCFEVTADGTTVSIDASDLDLHYIEFANITPPQDIVGTLSITASDLADATGSTLTGITLTGAALGDAVTVGTATDGLGLSITGYVSAANEGAIRVQNETGGIVTPPAGYKITVPKNVGLKTYTGTGIVFGPALSSGEKFNLMVIGY